MLKSIYRGSKKGSKGNKGAPSGFIISLIFHAVVFFMAGLFVVFTVLPKEKPKFEAAPSVERPKMKLKKPKVKIKKSSQPKPSSRIVAKVKTAKMPEIQIPDLVGTGEGLLGGLGGAGEFMDMPEIETLSLLGSSESMGTDLIGVYYDLKRKRRSITSYTGYGTDSYLNVVRDFIDDDWDESILKDYYRLPKKLYLTTLVVPVVKSSFAPVAFGDEAAAEGGQWLVLYKGKLVHRDGITFRFWAAGDYILGVRVDDKVVVASTWDTRDLNRRSLQQVFGNSWTPKAPENRQYIMGRNCLAYVGDWITLEPGVPKDIQILVGDENGLACAYLAVEEQGVQYEISSQGGPILPAFKTAEISPDMIDVIYPFLPKDEMISLTNGPVFNDLGAVKKKVVGNNPAPAYQKPETGNQSGMRIWTLKDGRTIEAELSNAVSFDESIKLIDPDRKELKVPYEQLSEADREYIAIVNVPTLDIDIMRSLKNVLYSSKIASGNEVRDPELHASFGVRVKQIGRGTYDHELTAEFFAVGRQLYADRYMLLARETVKFKLTPENKKFEYESKRKTIMRDFYISQAFHRGEKYHGYLVLVTDPLGNVVAHEESPDWMFDNLDSLKKLRVGNYFDKNGVRCSPERPEAMIDYSF